jgi:hypothetical protein
VTEIIEPVPCRIDQQKLAQDLVDAARTDGVELIGPNGLLTGLTKTVLETALDAELTEHLGYDKHDPMGRNRGNSRNGIRSKTVLTEIGPVEIEVPRDRDGSEAARLVPRRPGRGCAALEALASYAQRYAPVAERAKVTPAAARPLDPWSPRPGRPSTRSPPGHRPSCARARGGAAETGTS